MQSHWKNTTFSVNNSLDDENNDNDFRLEHAWEEFVKREEMDLETCIGIDLTTKQRKIAVKTIQEAVNQFAVTADGVAGVSTAAAMKIDTGDNRPNHAVIIWVLV